MALTIPYFRANAGTGAAADDCPSHPAKYGTIPLPLCHGAAAHT
jgi:hypothetical protein